MASSPITCGNDLQATRGLPSASSELHRFPRSSRRNISLEYAVKHQSNKEQWTWFHTIWLVETLTVLSQSERERDSRTIVQFGEVSAHLFAAIGAGIWEIWIAEYGEKAGGKRPTADHYSFFLCNVLRAMTQHRLQLHRITQELQGGHGLPEISCRVRGRNNT